MGAFNELMLTTDGGELAVQFKYGLKWQYQYKIGDTLDWGDLERPSSADGEVIVPGLLVSSVRVAPSYYAIKIINDVICCAQEISEKEYADLNARQTGDC